MKSNKKVLEKKVKKENEKKPKVYVEGVPRFVIGDSVLYFLDTSTEIEGGIVVGIFVQPGDIVKNYIYQIEYSFKNDKGKEIKGLCMPSSEDVIGTFEISEKDKEKFIKRFRELGIKKLDDRIKEYLESIDMAKENVKTQIKYQKDTARVIKGLEKRKMEILNS